jgi:hypothetical protein
MIHTGWVFDEDVKRVDDCRTHDFMKLLQIAGIGELLTASLRTSASAGGDFVRNWDVVEEWSVTSRYQSRSEVEAKTLLAAIADDPHGILKWIRNYW